MKILHIASKSINPKFQQPQFLQELKKMGEVCFLENGSECCAEELLEHVRGAEVFLTGHGSIALPVELAEDPGRLKYICNLTGSVQGYVPRELFDAGIPVSNWGDAPAFGLGESALTLVLALLKELPRRVRTVEAGGWGAVPGFAQGSLKGLTVGLYGYGFSGRMFHELLRPFRTRVRVFDPFVKDLPEDAQRVDSLEALFEQAHVVSIHAALTPETKATVTASLLARIPDGGILVNTARGDIVDQAALFAELERGRLRAGLDVLAEKDWLEPDHPARRWPNLLLTCHKLTISPWPAREEMDRLHEVCLNNLQRFKAGLSPEFLLNGPRLLLST